MTAPLSKAFSAAVGLIYDAGLDDQAFARMPLAIGDTVASDRVTMPFLDRQMAPVEVAMSYYPDDLWPVYFDQFRDKEVWLTRGLTRAIDTFMCVDDVVPLTEFFLSARGCPDNHAYSLCRR